MGNNKTTGTKLGMRRKALRQLAPFLPEPTIVKLAIIDDPAVRFERLLHLARSRRAEQHTVDAILDRLRSIYTQQHPGDPGKAQRRLEALTAEPADGPDDRRYRPGHVDPVLRGDARATGQSAAAVKRGTTVTDWQHAARSRR